MTLDAKPRQVLYENLDTSFVNLWALLRYLSQRSFIGRVHVELKDYTADVFLTGSNHPLVHEVDREAGSDVVEDAALHRLVLRVRESPGSISVYEGAEETVGPQASVPEAPIERTESDADELTVTASAKTGLPDESAQWSSGWGEIISTSGELIGGVECAVLSGGGDFAAVFRESRIALADDYAFLDPMSGSFHYENSAVTLNGELPANSYVTGIIEVLRRVVDQTATGDRARRTRERVALELARVARKNDDAMTRSSFKAQLDRIAGTKVI